MRNRPRIGIGLLIVSAAVLMFGVLTVWAKPPRPPGPGKCECANLDAPVICDGGKTYPNPCVADCFGATGCVPTGGGPIP